MAPQRTDLAARITAYMMAHRYRYSTVPGHTNIVYLEGSNADGTPNANERDRWNDRRLVITFQNLNPVIVHNAQATTEPGWAATMSAGALQRGGVARVLLGQYRDQFVMGFHKHRADHPALRQHGTINVTRDANRDGKRAGDPIKQATGINQHGTRPGWSGKLVGMWSEGCLVGLHWDEHMAFMRILQTDPRYVRNRIFLWDTTIIDAAALQKWWRENIENEGNTPTRVHA